MLPQWQECNSDANVASFLVYLGCYASDSELRELVQLPVVQHLSRADVPATPLPLGACIDSRWVQLPSISCRSPRCSACATESGGIMFCWVDSRWTPAAALLPEERRVSEHVTIDEPWPNGILRAPRPWRQAYALSPQVFPSNDWQAFFDECEDMAPYFIVQEAGCVAKAVAAEGLLLELNDKDTNASTNLVAADCRQIDAGISAVASFEII